LEERFFVRTLQGLPQPAAQMARWGLTPLFELLNSSTVC